VGEVVARRPGLVEQVIVLQGEAAVKPGDTVQAGDVLIRGRPEGTPARGIVLARTWYAAYAEQEKVERVEVYTGRSAVAYRLRLGGRVLHLAGPRQPPFAAFRLRQEISRLLPGRGSGADVELLREIYAEVTVHQRPLSTDEARRRVEARLKVHLLAQVGLGARIMGVRSGVVQDTPAAVGVRMTVECLEDIGQVQPRPLPGP
jgi:similar to stage IV sporulation protein